MTAAYFHHGVELVNTGGDRCSACERPAIGFLNAHPICARHAGWAAHEAAEMAQEKEAAAKRVASRTDYDRERVARIHERLNAAVGAAPPVSPKGSATLPRRSRVSPSMKRAADAANAKKKEHHKGIRDAAILGAMEKAGEPATARAITLLTGLSHSLVKRTILELVNARLVTAKRAHKSSTFYYAVARRPR